MIGEAPDCTHCEHFDPMADNLSCKAFPEGIPEEILNGEKHNKPRKGQKNKIVYEKLVITKNV